MPDQYQISYQTEGKTAADAVGMSGQAMVKVGKTRAGLDTMILASRAPDKDAVNVTNTLTITRYGQVYFSVTPTVEAGGKYFPVSGGFSYWDGAATPSFSQLDTFNMGNSTNVTAGDVIYVGRTSGINGNMTYLGLGAPGPSAQASGPSWSKRLWSPEQR